MQNNISLLKIKFYPQAKPYPLKFPHRSLEDREPRCTLLRTHPKQTPERCCVSKHFQEMTSKRPITRALTLITTRSLGAMMKLIQQNGWIYNRTWCLFNIWRNSVHWKCVWSVSVSSNRPITPATNVSHMCDFKWSKKAQLKIAITIYFI